MERVLVVIAACALATTAVAADKAPQPAAAAAKKTSEPAKKGPSPKSELVTAKQAMKAAVELCDGERCEPGSRSLNREYLTMLQDTEKRFVEACERCSTQEKCESERQRIRDGKRSLGSAPCP